MTDRKSPYLSYELKGLNMHWMHKIWIAQMESTLKFIVENDFGEHSDVYKFFCQKRTLM